MKKLLKGIIMTGVLLAVFMTSVRAYQIWEGSQHTSGSHSSMDDIVQMFEDKNLTIEELRQVGVDVSEELKQRDTIIKEQAEEIADLDKQIKAANNAIDIYLAKIAEQEGMLNSALEDIKGINERLADIVKDNQ